ncbi:MAG TPA: HNH endonuclease, partial [Kofleriaceae bacterium]
LGGEVDENALMESLLEARESGGARAETSPRYMIQTTVCEQCKQAFVDAGGRRRPISEDERELAECDAVRIGSDGNPTRATKDVTPKTRRSVWVRDRGKCVMPGCRSKAHLDIHHLVPRSDGGGHGADNLGLLCAGHHRLLHQGGLDVAQVTANVTRPRAVLKPKPSPRAEVATPLTTQPEGLATTLPKRESYNRVVMKTEATETLVYLEFNRPQARSMVERAAAVANENVTLEELVVAALQLAGR